MTGGPGEVDPLQSVADEFLERYRRGERPTLDEYKARYPELAGPIDDLFPALVEMERFGSADPPTAGAGPAREAPRRLGDYRILREIGRGGMGVVYEAEQVSLGRRVALKVLPAHAPTDERVILRFRREAQAAARLHHTNIVPVFGVGEQDGLHYYVMQFIRGRGLDEVIRELHRLRHAGPLEGGRRARDPTAAEASAADMAWALATGQFAGPRDATCDPGAAALDPASPGGVPDGSGAMAPTEAVPTTPRPAMARDPARGAADDLPSAVSRSGPRDLASFTETSRRYWVGVARVVFQVAQALQYAHTQGILHRDIKPSNLLLDPWGTVWVTDFGLAKVVADADLTHTGDVMGTLRYMAPERFNGLADARSDLYALGLTLYELLTLRRAFDESDRNRLIRRVTEGEPPRPRRIAPAIPRDLETICLKCIEKQPSRRYGSAEALAEDLENWLQGRPIAARRVSPPERAAKWARRKPALAGLLASLLGGVILGAWYNVRLRAALDESRREQAKAELSAYIADINLARRAVAGGEIAGALAELEKVGPRVPGDVDRRGFEWHYLRRLCSYELRRSWDAGRPLACLAYSPDGLRLASGHGLEGKSGFVTGPGSVQIRDAETGRVVREFAAHRGPVFDLAYSPDGFRLATAGADGTVRVWDVGTGALVLTLAGHRDTVNGVAFSPDGRRVVTTGGFRYPSTGYGPPEEQPGEVAGWDAETGRRLWREDDPAGAVYDVGFAPDGLRVASGGITALSFRDPATGRVLASYPDIGGFSVSFRADGLRLATCGMGRGVVWDVASGRVIVSMRSPTRGPNRYGWVGRLAFHPPEGDHLAVSFGHESNQLPDIPRLQARRSVVRIWDSQRGVVLYRLMAHRAPVRGLAFRPGGSELATADEAGKLNVWTTYSGKPPATVHTYGQTMRPVAFSPDGESVAAGGEDGAVRLLDPASGVAGAALSGHSLGVLSLAFRPDGRQLASGAKDHTVRVWDPRAGGTTRVLAGHRGPVNGVAYSPDGRTLASAGGDGWVMLWDPATGHRVRTLEGHAGGVLGVAFHPDGRSLATAGGDGLVKLWDPVSGDLLRAWRGHRTLISCLAFDSDGRRLATAGADRAVNLWDPADGRLVQQLPLRTQDVYGLAFGGAGRTGLRARLAAVGQDQNVRLWDPETGQEVLSLTGHTGEVLGVAFSGDGRRLATASSDRTVRLWDGRESPFVAREPDPEYVPAPPVSGSPGR